MPSNSTYVGGGMFVALAGLIYWLQRQMRNLDTSCLRNKVVLVTGASSGLGEASAKAFYRAGAKVILCARREKELERVKQMLMGIKLKAGSPVHEPHIAVLDLEDLTNIPQIVNQIVSTHGSIDILLNNAGVSFRGDILNTAIDVFVKVMNVNFFGQVAVTKAVLPHMVSKRSGHIVMVSSLQGKIAIPYRSAYAASKHAIQAFSDSLRAEVANDNIQVSVISPSYIRTNLSVNAVTRDGSKYGATDSTTAQGILPGVVARQLVQAVCERSTEVLTASLSHRAVVYLRNILPNVYFSFMKSRAIKQRSEYLKNQ